MGLLVVNPSASADLIDKQGYEVIAQLDVPPGNVAVGPDGRIVLSIHQMYQPKVHLVELLPDGSVKPYPSETWAMAHKPGSDIGTQAVLGVQIDKTATLWFIDNASNPPRVVAWDMKSEKLKRIYNLPGHVYTPGNTLMNDMALNLKDQKMYIADFLGKDGSGIVILDLKTGQSWRVLSGHKVTAPEADKQININGKTPTLGGKKASIGVNPITISPDEKWVYFGSMNGTSIYRIPSEVLGNPDISSKKLIEKIERYGYKAISDGISIDDKGNIYVTDLNDSAIGVTSADGKYKILYQNKEKFQWLDSIAATHDGFMIVNTNKLHLSATLNAGKNESKPPYYIIKFKPLANVSVGR